MQLADDRRSREDLPTDLADGRGPGMQERLDTTRGSAGRGAGFRKGLDDVERKALGALEQGIDCVSCRRAAEDHLGEGRDIPPAEPHQADAGRRTDPGRRSRSRDPGSRSSARQASSSPSGWSARRWAM